MHMEALKKQTRAGLYTGFLPRGGELGVCQKELEAVRSSRAATGGVGAGGGCAPSRTNFLLI